MILIISYNFVLGGKMLQMGIWPSTMIIDIDCCTVVVILAAR